MTRSRILIAGVEGTEPFAGSLSSLLGAARSFDFDVRMEFLPAVCEGNPETVLCRALTERPPHVLVLCVGPVCSEHIKVLFAAARQQLRTGAIVIAAQPVSPDEWREFLGLGPDDFITPPFRDMDVLPRLWRLHPHSTEDDLLVAQLKAKMGLKQLIGESQPLLAEIRKIPLVARCAAAILIQGETGTGKEMFARAIHFLSTRAAKPFSPLNCGAIPVDLVENELFGHETGAFTGANGPATGLLHQTDGGSLFLDEVDCLPLLAQVKLLRFLQEKEFRPLGAQKPHHVDVRVIAASNSNLEDAVKQGRFRSDLYFRLNVIGLQLPPLRQRKDDIPLLAQHFVRKYAADFDGPARHLSAAAVQKLMLYDWPGNVRELENVVARSVALSHQPLLGPDDIALAVPTTLDSDESFQSLKARMIAHFECGYIQALLRTHDGNITKAARAAGKHRRAFWEIMRKYRITVQPPAQGSRSVSTVRHRG